MLEDPEIRVGLSEHSNWPTMPQLFVKGELIGGCDIVMEMESKGELGGVLQTAWTWLLVTSYILGEIIYFFFFLFHLSLVLYIQTSHPL